MSNSIPTLLVLDASSQWCSAALLVKDERYADAQLQPRKHAQLIMPMIDGLFQQAGISPQQLDGVAFGAGPGSFTGLRIATAVAQGIAFASGAKMLGISSLKALAYQSMKQHGHTQVLAMMNAHMGELFYGAYEKTDAGLVAHIDDSLATPERVDLSVLNSALNSVLNSGKSNSKPWCGAGDGFEFQHQITAEELTQLVSIDTEIAPMAESMLDLALHAWQAGKFGEPEDQQPVYLRDSVAWKKLSEQPSLLKK